MKEDHGRRAPITTTTKAAQRVVLCTYHGNTRKLEGEGEHGGAASSPNPNPRFGVPHGRTRQGNTNRLGEGVVEGVARLLRRSTAAESAGVGRNQGAAAAAILNRVGLGSEMGVRERESDGRDDWLGRSVRPEPGSGFGLVQP